MNPANQEEDKFDEYGFRLENFDLYKPKKYYLEPESEEELRQILKKIEDQMKDYKYHEDIPRIDYAYTSPGRGIDAYEEGLWMSCICGPILGYVYSNLAYGTYSGPRSKIRCAIVWTLISAAYTTFRGWLNPKNQPQNQGILGQLPIDVKLKNELDLKFDAYRNIEKIKYKDKFLSEKQVRKKFEELEKKRQVVREELYKKYGL